MLNKLDLLSPPITLFYLEKRTHTSKIGGFLILLLSSLCSIYLIYLLYLIIQHKQVTSIFYKKFQYDIGQYYFNSSSFHFFIQFHSIEADIYQYKFASKYVRTYSYYGNTEFDETNLGQIDHWTYDSCINGLDNKYLDSSLFQNISNFEGAACLRYYYNSEEKKYYSKGENGFIYPYLAHGTAQKNNIFLHTTIQKCTNDSIINKIFGDCPSQNEIDEYSTKIVAIFLYFVDNQVDPTNYRNPIQQYMHSVTAGMGTVNSFEENCIFYSPLKVKTKYNSILEKNNDLESLFFDTSTKLSSFNNENYFKYTRFTHFVQNNIQIYERRYNDILEILSDIGGILQCMFNIFYWINYFYNKYIIISDTNNLFFSIIEKRADSLTGEKIKKLNLNNNNNNNKKSNVNDSSVNALKIKRKSKTIMENLMNKYNYGYNIIDEKSGDSYSKDMEDDKSIKNKFKINLIQSTNKNKNSSDIFTENKNSNNNSNNNIFITNKIKELHYHTSNKKIKNSINKKYNKQRTISFSQERIKNDLNYDLINNNLANQTIKISQLFTNKIKLEKKYSFFNFIKSICSSKINNINFLIRYRKGLLSEEHFLKSHINHIMLEKKLSVDKYHNINVVESIKEN